jgi:hypothetical protein
VKLFGDPGTLSQNWVTNIGDIHDTLARMGGRLSSPVPRSAKDRRTPTPLLQ